MQRCALAHFPSGQLLYCDLLVVVGRPWTNFVVDMKLSKKCKNALMMRSGSKRSIVVRITSSLFQSLVRPNDDANDGQHRRNRVESAGVSPRSGQSPHPVNVPTYTRVVPESETLL